ncbi:hypothetical protein CC80DRAFT_509538 [Byssothecium circinans]|uniref:Uncharacterized protein n=1 Tax=Byssothecium circinans TaxID=147558 RepID=A0A6A5TCT0_9PLEO|nr:hypothetical protein CC80DRAFT_509538 [Byssothecium circinans]
MSPKDPPSDTEHGFICGKETHCDQGEPNSSFVCDHINIRKELKTDGTSNTCNARRISKKVWVATKALTVQTPQVVRLNPGERLERGWVYYQPVGVGGSRDGNQYHGYRSFAQLTSYKLWHAIPQQSRNLSMKQPSAFKLFPQPTIPTMSNPGPFNCDRNHCTQVLGNLKAKSSESKSPCRTCGNRDDYQKLRDEYDEAKEAFKKQIRGNKKILLL